MFNSLPSAARNSVVFSHFKTQVRTYFINFASQAGRAPQQLAPITVAPFLPSQPRYTTEDRPQHRELRALLLATSVWVLLRPTGLSTLKGCETGPPAYRPYPRRLESLTICRCSYKGRTFFSVTLSVGPAGVELATSRVTVRCSINSDSPVL